jgi:hypothetical protein
LIVFTAALSQDPQSVLDLFPGVDREEVKQLIHATYNGAGEKFQDKWLARNMLGSFPEYYTCLQAEVQKMGRLDMGDVELVAKVKAAGITEPHKVQSRVVFTKNEIFEARNREKALAAFDSAGGSSLVSLEHDGTPRLMSLPVDLVAIAAAAGVSVVVKPYRNKDELIQSLKDVFLYKQKDHIHIYIHN